MVAVAAATTALLVGTGSGAFAVASTSDPNTEAVVSALRGRFASFGLASDVQDRLIEKVLSGATLEAYTVAVPTSSETKTGGGVEKTRNVYADGSVAIGTIGSPTARSSAAQSSATESSGGISLKSIRNCDHRVDGFGTNIFVGCG